MFKTKKGQAAVTDALFFLLIIVTVSVLLFRYSATYGSRLNVATSDLYFKDYSNSVLRTVFYTSVPLDYDLNVYSAKETDYLMTQIKQDFYADGRIGNTDLNALETTDYRDLAKFNLFNTIKATMFPLKSHDYTFYLYDQGADKYLYFMIKITNYEQDDEFQETPTREVRYNISDTFESYYLCEPNGYIQVRDVISKSPSIFSSSVPLSFKKYTTSSTEQREFVVIATFAIWPSTVDINNEVLETLNCKIV